MGIDPAESRCFFIAEIGVNHESSLERAKSLIQLAAGAGADAVKFQTYKADLLARVDSPAYWDTLMESSTSQHALFSKYDGFGLTEYAALANFAADNKVEFLSTPFDTDSVKLLEPLVARFKVSSSDITNFQLLKAVARSNKPVILSTGASTISEIKSAIAILKKFGSGDVSLLHCMLNYPTKTNDAHLGAIRDLKRHFPELTIGYSDHTQPSDCCLVQATALLLGASIIEKHFTDDKSAPGNDHYHSFDAQDLRNFRSTAEMLNQLLRPLDWESRASEVLARKYARRSIVYRKSMKANEVITEDKIIALRPNDGVSASNFLSVIGSKLIVDVQAGVALRWDDIERKDLS